MFGIVFLLTLVLLGSVTVLVTSDGVITGKRGYNKSLSNYQVADCGNGETSTNTLCLEMGAQNQGRENSAAQSGNLATSTPLAPSDGTLGGDDNQSLADTDNAGMSQSAGSQSLTCANEQFAVNTFCQQSSAQNQGENITNNQDQILEFTIGDVGGHVGVVNGTPPFGP
jgi:hypothetical protein